MLYQLRLDRISVLFSGHVGGLVKAACAMNDDKSNLSPSRWLKIMIRNALLGVCCLLGSLDHQKFILAQPLRTTQLVLPENWETSLDFQRARERWIAVSLLNESNTLRQVCFDLAHTQKVAVVLDRRLDPNAAVLLEPPVTGGFIRVIEQVAVSQQAEIREVGDALFLIPHEKVGPFTTLHALRREEFVQLTQPAGKRTATASAFRFDDPKQIQKILSLTSYRWDNFQAPRELLIQKVTSAGLSLQNPERIPHDLWATGELPRANLLEFLTFVLFQYELTYEFVSKSELLLKPFTEPLQIARRYNISQQRAIELEAFLVENYPDATWRRDAAELEVSASEDVHLAISAILDPPRKPPASEQAEWKSRQFTMRVQRKTVQEILEYLQQSGLPVRYDLEALKKAGHPLETSISFELASGSIEELMNAICQPIRLPYRLTDEEIQIGQ